MRIYILSTSLFSSRCFSSAKKTFEGQILVENGGCFSKVYKKSELMLMRRATASVSFRTQVVLVYLHISANIHCKCASQPKIAKKSLKTPILGVQGRSRSSMLIPPESSSAVLVMISSKSVSICNHCRARLVDSSRNRTFSRGYTQLWCARTEDSLNLGGQTLHRWNLRLMPNISYAGCPGPSWMVSAQFSLKMCIAA